ncbi:TVP38/TMEM64 family protein [Halorientalis brevis]|uniref:TVP38/TMEM64 family protein n=1 Tax=Halorientalis brevis TaxID=1126241 RepID=A0ABD6C7F8_9EURY|nr:VTT domain-containing protein [Halorientalis brevis]
MQRATRRQLFGSVLAGGAVLAAAVVLSPAAVLGQAETLSSRPALFLAALTVIYLFRPFVLWPISAVSVLVGYVYGVAIGIPLGLAGAVVTSLPPFVLARYVRSDDGVFGYLGQRGDRLVEATGALRGIVAARLAPLPADGVSYAAGLSQVSAVTMLVGTALGETPWVIAAVTAGSSMRTLSLQGLSSGLPLVVGAGSLAVLVLAGPAYRHLRDGGDLA